MQISSSSVALNNISAFRKRQVNISFVSVLSSLVGFMSVHIDFVSNALQSIPDSV